MPDDVAWAHALGPELQQAPDIIAIAEATGRPVETVTAAVHDLGARLEVMWLLAALDQLPQPTRTQRWATQAVREDCLEALADLARAALQSADAGVPATEAVDRYLEERGTLVRRLAHVTQALTVEGSATWPDLMLAVRALRALAG